MQLNLFDLTFESITKTSSSKLTECECSEWFEISEHSIFEQSLFKVN